MGTENMVSQPRKQRSRLVILAALMAVGLGLALWQPSFLETLLDLGRDLAGRPWAPVVLVTLHATLLALALPGSLMLLVIAPLYPPVTATVLLTSGAVLGALGGYFFSGWAGGARRIGHSSSRIMTLLSERGDFLTQLALRVMPGFPHSVINYGAGILGLPLATFLGAAALGLAVKWFVYTSAIYALIQAGAEEEPLGLQTVGPLLLLAVLLAVSAVGRQWLLSRRRRKAEHRL
jgi:uncharacterized membrane protein YdjX (TVP38/TMEM64 family)